MALRAFSARTVTELAGVIRDLSRELHRDLIDRAIAELGEDGTSMVARKEPEQYTVDDLAQLALTRAKGKPDEAVKLLAAWAEDDPLTLRGLTEPFLEQAARRAINRVFKETRPVRIRSIIEQRRAVATGETSAPATATSGISRMAAANAQRLLDWQLPDGTKLADARRSGVQSGALHYAKSARRQRAIATWLERIGRTLGEYDRVKDVYDEAGLKALFDDVKANGGER